MEKFDFKVKLSLTNEERESFMGIGLVWLLDNIKQYHSINIAAKQMNMSYVKALKIINRLEDNLGYKVITRKNGGEERGGSELTEKGIEFIEKFKKFQQNVNSLVEKEFKKFYK